MSQIKVCNFVHPRKIAIQHLYLFVSVKSAQTRAVNHLKQCKLSDPCTISNLYTTHENFREKFWFIIFSYILTFTEIPNPVRHHRTDMVTNMVTNMVTYAVGSSGIVGIGRVALCQVVMMLVDIRPDPWVGGSQPRILLVNTRTLITPFQDPGPSPGSEETQVSFNKSSCGKLI